jgi:hypothetical protein
MSAGIDSQPVLRTADRPDTQTFRQKTEDPLTDVNAPCETRTTTVSPVVAEGIRRFEGFLGKNGFESFDPYDVWGTCYGLFSRRVYYAKGVIGLPLIAPILLMEAVCPSLRRWFVRKDRFGTADGQLTTAFLNLYHVSGDRKYLDTAVRLGEDMLKYSVSGYSGKCWGYPFDWQNNRGLWKKNTPYITCTPYCFAGYVGLYDATGEQRYLDIARSIATFVYTDLKDTPAGPAAAAASYSPMDATKVVNASAYRAWVLFEADARFNLTEYRAKAQRNLNFILQSQRADGAWLYATEGSGEGFIDHFHTAFVLKNLYKINQRLKNPAIDTAIKKGWEFYRRELFAANGLPKSFALEPRKQIVKLEMYNFAEAITLGALLKDFIPEAFTLAQDLAETLCSRYQLPDGHFVTRVFKFGFRHTFPFLRWPQAQLFYSLTNLLHASQKGARQ